MLEAVPLGIALGRQPEVAPQVDGPNAFLDQPRRDRRAGAVRKRQEGEVGPTDHFRLHRFQLDVGVRREVRVDLADGLPGALPGRDHSHIGSGVVGQQAQQLRPRVAGGAEDGDADRPTHHIA